MAKIFKKKKNSEARATSNTTHQANIVYQVHRNSQRWPLSDDLNNTENEFLSLQKLAQIYSVKL